MPTMKVSVGRMILGVPPNSMQFLPKNYDTFEPRELGKTKYK